MSAPSPLAAAVLACLAASAHAGVPADSAEAHDLDTVTVTATRTERALADVRRRRA